MKPLLSESQETETLQDLGRASVQIVHDLKNQLNGLKLYATFLRKRLEKHAAPQDEQETIAKLIAGLERAAADTTTLVRYGRPLELRRQPAVDLRKLLAALTAEGEGAASSSSTTGSNNSSNSNMSIPVSLAAGTGPLEGEFDVAALREAFQAITVGARGLLRAGREGEQARLEIHLRREEREPVPEAFIEWRGVTLDQDSDPFRSFAGSDALRMSLAAKIIRAHGGEAGQAEGALQVRLPLADRQT